MWPDKLVALQSRLLNRQLEPPVPLPTIRQSSTQLNRKSGWDYPPLTACIIVMQSPSRSGILRSLLHREFLSFTKHRTCSLNQLDSSNTSRRNAGVLSNRAFIASTRSSPSTSISPPPPTTSVSSDGKTIVTRAMVIEVLQRTECEARGQGG